MAEETTSQDAAQQTDEEQAKSGRTDWKAEARKWEQRAKENKDAADELAALKKQQAEKDEAEKSDLQKATEKADKAIAELEAMKAEKKRTEMLKAAAKSYEVDEELLSMMTGDTKDEIEANAKTLKAKIDTLPRYPNVKDGGGQGISNRPSKKEIMEIKNPREQLRVAAQNLDAFD